MKDRYLEVTFRNGKPFAAYLYLPRLPDDHSARVEPHDGGLLVDRTEDGRAIGIEILEPSITTLESLNALLASIAEEPLTPQDVAPLCDVA